MLRPNAGLYLHQIEPIPVKNAPCTLHPPPIESILMLTTDPSHSQQFNQIAFLSDIYISILTAAKIDGKYLRLPRGVESSLKDNCYSYLKEQFTLSKALNVEFTGTLRPQQEEAVNKIDKID